MKRFFIPVVLTAFVAFVWISYEPPPPRVAAPSAAATSRPASFGPDPTAPIRRTPLPRRSTPVTFEAGDPRAAAPRTGARSRADTLFQEGMQAATKGDIDGAIGKWRMVLAVDPSRDDARKKIAEVENIKKFMTSKGISTRPASNRAPPVSKP